MTEYRQPDVVAQPIASDPTVSTAPPEDASLKDRAGDAAQTGKQAAGDLAATAQDRAKDVMHEGKRQARNLLGEAQDQLRDQAGAQQNSLVKNLRSLGDELRSMSERGEQNGVASDLVGQAGERAHGVASWLDDREPGQLLDELRDFARRRPGVFLAGAVALGVVAGRLTRGVVAVHSDDTGNGAGHVEGYPSTQTGELPTGPVSGPYQPTVPGGYEPTMPGEYQPSVPGQFQPRTAEPYSAPVQYPAGEQFPGTQP
jgi:hypothetical protein